MAIAIKWDGHLADMSASASVAQTHTTDLVQCEVFFSSISTMTWSTTSITLAISNTSKWQQEYHLKLLVATAKRFRTRNVANASATCQTSYAAVCSVAGRLRHFNTVMNYLQTQLYFTETTNYTAWELLLLLSILSQWEVYPTKETHDPRWLESSVDSHMLTN